MGWRSRPLGHYSGHPGIPVFHGRGRLPTQPEPETWPTNGWQTTTPEEQGFDSLKLAEGLSAIQKTGIPIHSVLLVRDGKILLEAYFYPYDGQAPHSTSSVTKSVTTTPDRHRR